MHVKISTEKTFNLIERFQTNDGLVLTLIRCPFHPRVTAVASKRPPSFCQKCRWQVTFKHAYTLDPVQAECGNLSGTSLHATCQGTFGHSHLSSLSHCGLILT